MIGRASLMGRRPDQAGMVDDAAAEPAALP